MNCECCGGNHMLNDIGYGKLCKACNEFMEAMTKCLEAKGLSVLRQKKR